MLALVAALAVPARAFPPYHHVARTRCVLARAPVDLTLSGPASATAGAPFTLHLTARARSACADVQLGVQLPAGTTLASGVAGWQGAMAAGETRTLDVSVTVPDGFEHRFFAVARVFSGVAVMVRQASFAVGHSLHAQAVAQPPVITAPDGTRMMVLPARER